VLGCITTLQKLFLCSHAFRGVSTQVAGASGRHCLSIEMREMADVAVLSATSILRSLNSDIEFQSFLSNLPLHFKTMIAFASVFLFRIATSYSHAIQVDTTHILRLLHQSVGVLEEVASKIQPAHLLARITEGLRQLLTQFEEARHRVNQPTAPLQMGPSEPDVLLPDATNIPQDSYDWVSGMDGFSLGNYDFLSHTQMTSGFEMWTMDSGQQQTFHPF
jgi:hypothetical protein